MTQRLSHLQEELLPARAVTRQNGGSCCCGSTVLRVGGESRDMTLFSTSIKLHSGNKQNKMEEISLAAWLEVLVHIRMHLPNRKNPWGAEKRGERDVRAKTVLHPGRYSHLRPLLPRRSRTIPLAEAPVRSRTPAVAQ